MKKILLLALLTALLSSCVGITNISTPQTVALNQGNFKFVKSVSAETEATYVFGIGGFREEATADVVSRLLEVAQLQSNQALADIRIKSTTNCYLGIVVKRFLTVTASVVEFCDIATNTFIERPISEIIEEEVVLEQPLEEGPLEVIKEKENLTIEYVLKRLENIKQSLDAGDVVDKEELNNEIKMIREWYYKSNLNYAFPEVEKYIRKIKKQLKD